MVQGIVLRAGTNGHFGVSTLDINSSLSHQSFVGVICDPTNYIIKISVKMFYTRYTPCGPPSCSHVCHVGFRPKWSTPAHKKAVAPWWSWLTSSHGLGPNWSLIIMMMASIGRRWRNKLFWELLSFFRMATNWQELSKEGMISIDFQPWSWA